ncbi:MAG: hypothetical protein CVU38_19005 [Chloroflexi bacterium HGW-Chloroflexi-1]|nr:MAG: hypothetical protein CVU38_19005 [Chloroflexi bacterium HGW-Chloroflexi-1]
MGITNSRRVRYRIGQFIQAVLASATSLNPAGAAKVRTHLPETAWPLFSAMSQPDQRHGLRVLRALESTETIHPALAQAALLHDCAKHEAVRLWHRVAVVLLKAFRPGWLACFADTPAPVRTDWRYPLWTHVNHPQRGAEMAAAAGCDPLAVTLIRHHQDVGPAPTGDPWTDRLLVALQAADDDN